MSTDSKETRDQQDLRIIRGIQGLPDLEPPPALMASVMKAIQAKRPPWHRRVYLWATAPKSITISPLRVAPAIGFLLAVIVGGVWFITDKDTGPSRAQQADRLPVVFTLDLAGARSVSVIGSFNNWKTAGYELQLDKTRNVWSLTVSLPEGRHEYAFLVDGDKVVSDPGALFFQEDGFGQRNAVLILRKNNGEDV